MLIGWHLPSPAAMDGRNRRRSYFRQGDNDRKPEPNCTWSKHRT